MSEIEFVSAAMVVAVVIISLHWHQHKMGFFDWLAFRRKVKYKIAGEKRERREEKKAERRARREEKKKKSIWHNFTFKTKFYFCYLMCFTVAIATGIGGRRDYMLAFMVTSAMIIIFEAIADSSEKPERGNVSVSIERVPEHKRSEVLKLINKHTEIEDKREDA